VFCCVPISITGLAAGFLPFVRKKRKTKNQYYSTLIYEKITPQFLSNVRPFGFFLHHLSSGLTGAGDIISAFTGGSMAKWFRALVL